MKKFLCWMVALSVLTNVGLGLSLRHMVRKSKQQAYVPPSPPTTEPVWQPEPPEITALMPDSPGFYNLRFTARVGTQYVNKFVTLPCRVFVPRDYDKNKDPRPLVVYLHGDEERGSDLAALAKVGPEKRLREDQGFRDNSRFICVSPQCPAGETWDEDMMTEAVSKLVDHLGKTFRIDPERVSLTGAGIGAAGAWKVAGMDPKRFASVAVVAPRGAPAGGEEPRKLRQIYGSVAAAQNDKEGYSIYLATVDGLGKAKADLQVRTNGNNARECANWFYSDNGTWDWISNHKRRTEKEIKDRDDRDAKELAAAIAAVPKLPGQYKMKFTTWVGDKSMEVPYQLTLPRGYDAGNSKWPTIVFFSGAGEENPDLSAINSHGPCAHMREDPAFKEWCPFIIVSIIHDNSPERAKAAAELLDDLEKKVRIDPDRYYCTGFSLGGTTTWTVANAAPHKFAAAVSINGRDRCTDTSAKNLKYIKTWIIVGGADGDFYNGSVHMEQILSAAGNDVHLTVIPGEGHGSWPRYYNDRRFYDWLLQQHRLSPAERAERDKHPTTQPAKMLADTTANPEVLQPGNHWLEFATQMDGKPFNLHYGLYIPQGYDKAKETPLMVYLHGDDLRDTDQSTIFMHGSAVDPRREGKTAFPMIGIVPQLPHDKQWTDPKIVAMNEALLTEITARLRIDAQRIYILGHQSGAAGALAMATHNPAQFAACVALQGVASNQEEAVKRLKGMAVRLLAYVNDGGATSAAKQMADALAKAGVEADYAKIPEGKDAKDWLPFYTEPQLVKWLLDHHRTPQVTPTARTG